MNKPICIFGHEHENPNPFKVGDILVDPSPEDKYEYDANLETDVLIERNKEFQEQWASSFHESHFPEILVVEGIGCDWVVARGGYLGTMYIMTWDDHDTSELLAERRNRWLKKD